MTKVKRGSQRKASRREPRGRRIASEIIEGLAEAIQFERGERTGARFKAAPISARDATVSPAPQFDRDMIVALRGELGLTQPVFARVLNVSAETVKAWEQGKFMPQGAVNRLLELAQKNPSTLLGTVRMR